MGTYHLIVAPDGTTRFGRAVVDRYWDLVAERERNYRAENEVHEAPEEYDLYAEYGREGDYEYLEEWGIEEQVIQEKIDLIKGYMVDASSGYPWRRLPIEKGVRIYDETDLQLLGDVYEEACRERARHDVSGTDWMYACTVRWGSLPAFAMREGYGVMRG